MLLVQADEGRAAGAAYPLHVAIIPQILYGVKGRAALFSQRGLVKGPRVMVAIQTAKCSVCGAEVTIKADGNRFCPSCGVAFAAPPVTVEPHFTVDSMPPWLKAALITVGGFLLVAIVGGAVVAANGKDSSTSTSADNGVRSSACAMAERFVSQALRSPGSAKYPSCNEQSITQDGPSWTVSSYVDSQNSFGALLRSTYQAILRNEGGGTWTLVSGSMVDGSPDHQVITLR